MSLIGIIVEPKQEENMKKAIQEEFAKQNKKNEIIIINKKTIENIKNVKFQTIVINTSDAEILQNKGTLYKILSNTQYLIINSDNTNNLLVLDNLKATVITYGLNAKSTITVSSCEEDNIMICIQRTIETVSHIEIEPEEIKIQNEQGKNNNVHYVMAIVSVMLLYDLYNKQLGN